MKIKTIEVNEDTGQNIMKEIDINIKDISMMQAAGIYYAITIKDLGIVNVTTKEYFRILQNYSNSTPKIEVVK